MTWSFNFRLPSAKVRTTIDDYASEQVPRLQLEEMKKHEAAQGDGRKIRKRLVFVPGDEKIGYPEQRNLQRPRLFYRRELEARPLLVARQ